MLIEMEIGMANILSASIGNWHNFIADWPQIDEFVKRQGRESGMYARCIKTDSNTQLGGILQAYCFDRRYVFQF